MHAARLDRIRATGAFALVGWLVGLVAVSGLSITTYLVGAASVGVAWMNMPIPIEHRALGRDRAYLVMPVALLWPVGALVVLLFSLQKLSDRPLAILGGAFVAVLAIALFALVGSR